MLDSALLKLGCVGMDTLYIVDKLRFFFVWRNCGFCSLAVRLCLFCMRNLILQGFVETARRAEKSPSFLARIGRNHQSPPHVEFVAVALLVVGFGCVERTNHSINRNK